MHVQTIRAHTLPPIHLQRSVALLRELPRPPESIYKHCRAQTRTRKSRRRSTERGHVRRPSAGVPDLIFCARDELPRAPTPTAHAASPVSPTYPHQPPLPLLKRNRALRWPTTPSRRPTPLQLSPPLFHTPPDILIPASDTSGLMTRIRSTMYPASLPLTSR
ncbi:hypothetical protein BJV74DRAFT_954765 [Russula compacta]|nr:hypothetical protein BJV74DRAFT_954765 [Russula compacta]